MTVIWKQAGPQLMYGMLIAWGQWIVALVVTGALLVRLDKLDPYSPYNNQNFIPLEIIFLRHTHKIHTPTLVHAERRELMDPPKVFRYINAQQNYFALVESP